MAPHLTRQQFEERVEPLRLALLHEAYRRCGPDDADDVVQEAILAAFRSIEQFDASHSQANLLSWLMRRLDWACRTAQRSKTNRREILLPPDQVLALYDRAAPPKSEENDLPEMDRTTLLTIIHRLPITPLQEFCVRLWIDGHTQRQIGEYLQIGQPSVNTHIAAVRKKLEEVRYSEMGEQMKERIRPPSDAYVYQSPVGVWDRNGTSRDIQRRRWHPIREELRWMTPEGVDRTVLFDDTN